MMIKRSKEPRGGSNEGRQTSAGGKGNENIEGLRGTRLSAMRQGDGN